MNAKSLTIGSILLGLLSVWASRAGGLVSDEQLLYALGCLIDVSILSGIVLFFVGVSYGISWSVTQAYKMLYLNHASWKKEAGKRKIYRVAIWSGGMAMLACGTLFLLADNLSTNEKIVVGVFWLLACAFVGFSSPLVWRWTFDKLLPRFNRFVVGKKDDEHGHEALDRPPEPK